jgi:hypothetical protein
MKFYTEPDIIGYPVEHKSICLWACFQASGGLIGLQGGARRLWNESFVSAPQLTRSPLGQDKALKDAALMMVESTTSTKSGSVIHVS